MRDEIPYVFDAPRVGVVVGEVLVVVVEVGAEVVVVDVVVVDVVVVGVVNTLTAKWLVTVPRELLAVTLHWPL